MAVKEQATNYTSFDVVDGAKNRGYSQFFDAGCQIEDDTYNELMSVQDDFAKIDEEMWK